MTEPEEIYSYQLLIEIFICIIVTADFAEHLAVSISRCVVDVHCRQRYQNVAGS